VATSNLRGAEANVRRIEEVYSHLRVVAPFEGIITVRNVDVGALVNEGSTLLFRIAQTQQLRAYVNVPQADATNVKAGQDAKVSVSDLPDQMFKGTVSRTANAIDPSNRTLLTEVQIENSSGKLLPGMFAQVSFSAKRAEPPMLIKGDCLVIRANGPQVALVKPDHTIHFQPVTLGRDYGDRVEILDGIEVGQQIVVNPGDDVQEKVKVSIAPSTEKPATGGRGGNNSEG
jgi:RND family efflux transporter MFP subunit